MNILNSAKKLGLVYNTLAGPWPCEACGQLTQFAEIKRDQNHIFCMNELCRYERTVDTLHHRILENDGTLWSYDPISGTKHRIRMQ